MAQAMYCWCAANSLPICSLSWAAKRGAVTAGPPGYGSGNLFPARLVGLAHHGDELGLLDLGTGLDARLLGDLLGCFPGQGPTVRVDADELSLVHTVSGGQVAFLEHADRTTVAARLRHAARRLRKLQSL